MVQSSAKLDNQVFFLFRGKLTTARRAIKAEPQRGVSQYATRRPGIQILCPKDNVRELNNDIEQATIQLKVLRASFS